LLVCDTLKIAMMIAMTTSKSFQKAFQLLLIALSSCLSAATTSTTVTLYAEAANAVKGSISNQGIEVLQKQQQTGTQNSWNTYLEISAKSSKKYVSTFTFAPYTGDVSKVQTVTLQINSMGLPAKDQKRTFKIRQGGQWQKVATNVNAPDWKWYSQSVVLDMDVSSYFSSSGVIEIQLQSNNNKDVVDLDYLVIDLEVLNSNNSTQSPTPAPSTSVISTNKTWWQPKASDALTWQYQLQGKIDTSLAVDVYDIDLFDTPISTIQSLQSRGIKVICYFSAGSYEGWRPDWPVYFPFITNQHYTGDQPPFAGKMSGWNERWLDIRRIDLLSGIMTARIRMAVDKGCDAVDPDNMDAYSNGKQTGLNLTYDDQLTYNRWIADTAHGLGIAVGLKNDVGQLKDLVDYFDFVVNEQCFQYNECNGYTKTFIVQDKAVFGVEYHVAPATFCPKANADHFSFDYKKLSLRAYRIGCEKYS